jgi:hypothetical protein
MIESESGIDTEQLAHAVAGVLRDEQITVVNTDTDGTATDYRGMYDERDD